MCFTAPNYTIPLTPPKFYTTAEQPDLLSARRSSDSAKLSARSGLERLVAVETVERAEPRRQVCIPGSSVIRRRTSRAQPPLPRRTTSSPGLEQSCTQPAVNMGRLRLTMTWLLLLRLLAALPGDSAKTDRRRPVVWSSRPARNSRSLQDRAGTSVILRRASRAPPTVLASSRCPGPGPRPGDIPGSSCRLVLLLLLRLSTTGLAGLVVLSANAKCVFSVPGIPI